MALYLVYPGAATVTNDVIESNSVPTAPGVTFVPWVVTDGDMVASNYTYSGGVLSYTPPIPPTPVPVPNPVQFGLDVIGDMNISSTSKVYLATYFGVINNYDTSTANDIKMLWQALIGEFSSSWLDSDTQTLVEAHAVANNIPLV